MNGLYSLFVLIGLLILWGVSHLIAAAMGAPTVSSRREVINQALKLAQTEPGEKFIDLGCGYGAALKIAREHELQAEGVDVSPAAILWNRLMGRTATFGNVLTADTTTFDIIYIYLLPNLIKKLKLKIKKGARVLAIDFPLVGRKPDQIKTIAGHTIYLYRS